MLYMIDESGKTRSVPLNRRDAVLEAIRLLEEDPLEGFRVGTYPVGWGEVAECDVYVGFFNPREADEFPDEGTSYRFLVRRATTDELRAAEAFLASLGNALDPTSAV